MRNSIKGLSEVQVDNSYSSPLVFMLYTLPHYGYQSGKVHQYTEVSER